MIFSSLCRNFIVRNTCMWLCLLDAGFNLKHGIVHTVYQYMYWYIILSYQLNYMYGMYMYKKLLKNLKRLVLSAIGK